MYAVFVVREAATPRNIECKQGLIDQTPAEVLEMKWKHRVSLRGKKGVGSTGPAVN